MSDKFSNDQFEIEMGNFSKALREYAKERVERDYDYIVNRSSLNLAIKAGERVPLADDAAIRALPQRPWWPKFVAKRLVSKRGITLRHLGGKKKGTKTRWKFNPQKGRHYTVEIARAASKALVTLRLRRIGYIRSGFSPIIAKLKSAKVGAARSSGATKGTTKIVKKPGDVRVAQPELNPECLMFGGEAASEIMMTALQKALPVAAKDMRDFVRDRMLARAKKYMPESK